MALTHKPLKFNLSNPPEPPAAELERPELFAANPGDDGASRDAGELADIPHCQEFAHFVAPVSWFIVVRYYSLLFIEFCLCQGLFQPSRIPCYHLSAVSTEYLSKKELEAYLKISKGTVERLMKQGLPHIKLDRRVLFKKSDIDRWLETKRVK
jgi:excisionase family DNA binding protein